MPAKLERFTYEVGFPVGCIGITAGNEIVLGGGGGPGRSGVKNKLALYSVDSKKRTLKSISEVVLSSDEDAPTCLAIHPKDKVLVSSVNVDKKRIESGENSNCRVFKLLKKSIQKEKATKTICSTSDLDYQKTIAFDPAGKLIANGSTDGTLAVVQYPSLRPAFPFIEAADEVNDLDFNSAGKWLAVATDRELKVIATKSGEEVQTIDKPHTTSGESAVFRFSRFGRGKGKLGAFRQQTGAGVELQDVLYTVLNTRSRKQAYIALWDTSKWTKIATRPVCRSAITTFALSSSGKLLAFATASLQIAICDAHTLEMLMCIPAAHSFAITALAFDKDDRFLVSGSADESCQVFELPEQWPTALDGIVDLARDNLQVLAVLVVLLLAILVGVVTRL
ncbi:WD40 repeat-like protein [Martensiomyces pterosporus]|nr:WD40 repeat-like protein [Martensiomyces pterosporus]